ncbi:MAG: hypothetical protein E5X73_24215 [Mesorhizobium sp.]|nr:MAG: hypothetical protein E5X73_24215 [Mesorhizobium sp.]
MKPSPHSSACANGLGGLASSGATLESVVEHGLNRILSIQVQLYDWIRQLLFRQPQRRTSMV